jgi:hypothetical protein
LSWGWKARSWAGSKYSLLFSDIEARTWDGCAITGKIEHGLVIQLVVSGLGVLEHGWVVARLEHRDGVAASSPAATKLELGSRLAYWRLKHEMWMGVVFGPTIVRLGKWTLAVLSVVLVLELSRPGRC